MSANSDKLAKALNQLSFVSAIEHEQQDSAVNVLCRLKPGYGEPWAAVANRVLREADRRQGTSDHWHTHIARVYMLRNNKLAYGWTFVIMSANADKAINTVVGILRQIAQEISVTAKSSQPTQNRTAIIEPQEEEEHEADDDPPALGEDDDYTDSEGPLPKGAIPEADEQGNPIVPRSARVRKIKMAGLPNNYDRNAPDAEKRKGSWHIETRRGKAFRPPVRN